MTDPRVVFCRWLLELPGAGYRAARLFESACDWLNQLIMTWLRVPWGEVSGDLLELIDEIKPRSGCRRREVAFA